MAALRPGNDEKAWNDPPVFAYTEVQGTPAAAPKKRTPLNKRVPFPQEGLPPTTPAATLGSAPIGIPPLNPCALEARDVSSGAGTSQPSPSEQPPNTGSASDELKKETFENLEIIMSKFFDGIEKRRQEDVKKRLDLLRQAWEQGSLSTPVQHKMRELTSELCSGNCEKANTLHVSLMVDYVSEVSQWMVGIKQLIVAAQLTPGELSPAGVDTEAS
ncbi:steroid receptor RNA activator 1 isoform X2 [Ixodes scapularis]|uniref:steroid receptor RNA activator 1 isoform X2 n=1 Tax=Ixodes scapularis TaxID=6945 RepID=UPI001A9F3177|nr:steroid receptor RNA activator 1 isoform X2 [Ixodes scapularis]